MDVKPYPGSEVGIMRTPGYVNVYETCSVNINVNTNSGRHRDVTLLIETQINLKSLFLRPVCCSSTIILYKSGLVSVAGADCLIIMLSYIQLVGKILE